MNNTFTKKNILQDNALSYLIHSLVFLLPTLALVTRFGVSAMGFGFLLAAAFCWRAAKPRFVRHLTEIRFVLTALACSFAFALAGMLVHADIGIRALEKPSRMFFCVTVLLAVLAVRPSRKALWAGLIAGTVGGAVFICYQRWGLRIDRPGGFINSITFGDIELCMGMMCLAGVLDFKGRQALWPALGALAGLLGSVASGTRGGWIAIIFAALLFLKYGHFLRSRAAKGLLAVVLVLLAGSFLVEQTGVRQRLRQGVSDVDNYVKGGNAFTNVGVRLELWKGGLALAAEHPWRISTTREIHAELEREVAAGRLKPFVLDAEHFHNDMMHVLVYGGIPGLLVYLLSMLAPFLFFLRILRNHESASPAVIAPALAGLLLVVGYFSFGLTEVIFWSILSTMFYVQMLFLLMGFCLNAQDEGKTV
ncbi:O-antigen ligase family protein [Pseudoduganella sp. LjRoot289]|uniref:O-antigen ligase family protein n=1 Tax=Pseudoduganella sp. LjRoot289 TaxID=3342314 RepID=UPI003ECCCEED